MKAEASRDGGTLVGNAQEIDITEERLRRGLWVTRACRRHATQDTGVPEGVNLGPTVVHEAREPGVKLGRGEGAVVCFIGLGKPVQDRTRKVQRSNQSFKFNMERHIRAYSQNLVNLVQEVLHVAEVPAHANDSVVSKGVEPSDVHEPRQRSIRGKCIRSKHYSILVA